METSPEGDSAPPPPRFPSQGRVAKPWVKRLLASQGFNLPEEKQFWWSVHLETFLRQVRKRGPEIPLEQLVADYLAGLRLEQPPLPEWRVEQIRLALEVMVRGIEHWHWENGGRDHEAGQLSHLAPQLCHSLVGKRHRHPHGPRPPWPQQRRPRRRTASSRGIGPMHYVYVLHSDWDHGLYIGYSACLRRRLEEHRLGLSAATKHRRPWRLVYYEAYLMLDDALGRERFLKSGAGRTYLKKQCRHYFASNPLRSTA